MQDSNPYLTQEVLSASPFRLRYLLVARAEELCGLVLLLWKEGHNQEASGWILRVREILGELLGGVQDKENPASEDIADLYVFMLQLVTQAEQDRDTQALTRLQELLGIEKETWAQVQEAFGNVQRPTQANGSAPPQSPTSAGVSSGPAPTIPPNPMGGSLRGSSPSGNSLSGGSLSGGSLSGGSLSVEA